MAVTPDGCCVVSGSSSGVLRVSDFATGKVGVLTLIVAVKIDLVQPSFAVIGSIFTATIPLWQKNFG